MLLKIFQVGHPALRQQARLLSNDEILSPDIQRLIAFMRDTMRDAPGVGLAAPQIGESIQLAVIEDRPEYLKALPQEILTERDRSPVPFHVIINPQLTIDNSHSARFFEGCLSLSGFTALVPRATAVRVTCLNEHAQPVEIIARGWHARILQHEIDHLNGTLYIDRMNSRSFMTQEKCRQYWNDKPISQICSELGLE